MKANQEDRTFENSSSNNSFGWILAIIVVALIAVGVYFYSSNNNQADNQASNSAQTTNQSAPQPEIPVVTVESPSFVLPSLDESDEVFRSQLIGVSSELAPWLQLEDLVRRSVNFNDGLSRGEVQYKLLKLPAPTGKFIAAEQDGNLFLTDQNYQRYTVVQQLIATVEPEKLAPLFHQFRPLLEQAYGELGFNPEDMGASIIYTLNQILATPVIEQPIELTKQTAYYSFADDQLEQRSTLQKQLIRMGPETTKLLQQKAQALKTLLLTGELNNAEDTLQTN